MRIITIGGKKIRLVDRDVQAAKKIINNFFELIEEKGKEYNAPLFKYTAVVCMYVMSSEMLDDLTPSTVETILNAVNKNEERKKEQEKSPQ